MKTKSTNVLTRVRKYFPQVNKVVDAKEPVLISVKKQDNKVGRKKDPANCALAQACKRAKIATGAIINIGFSYLINGEVATRYRTSETVGREITSFDRHQDFATGKDYRLSQVSPSCRLNMKRSSGKGSKKANGTKSAMKVHHTTRIRIAKAN
jgi:hypothetical protein